MELVYDNEARREIVGISTGDQWRVLVGSRTGRTDPGWAENERLRIDRAANPRIWLIFSHYRGTENGLLDLIEAGGLLQETNQRQKGAQLFCYRKPDVRLLPSMGKES